MSESRTARTIRKALEERGWVLLRAEWEPITGPAGAEVGGWAVVAQHPRWDVEASFDGYNLNDVLVSITCESDWHEKQEARQ